MTDEENEETTEQTPETEAPEAEAVPSKDAPAEEPAAKEAPAEELAAEAPADEPSADADEDAEPEEQLGPKERRRRKRSTHSGEAAPQRALEERIAERLAKRKANAAERTRWRANSRKRHAGEPGEGTPPAERRGTGSPRLRQGLVVSDKADKTITVKIDIARQHRVYGKIVRTTSTLHAHDETNDANAGDTVRVVESRPLSKSKRWRLVEVVERAR